MTRLTLGASLSAGIVPVTFPRFTVVAGRVDGPTSFATGRAGIPTPTGIFFNDAELVAAREDEFPRDTAADNPAEGPEMPPIIISPPFARR